MIRFIQSYRSKKAKLREGGGGGEAMKVSCSVEIRALSKKIIIAYVQQKAYCNVIRRVKRGEQLTPLSTPYGNLWPLEDP